MTDPVARQYEAYPYPARDPRDEARRLILGSPSDLREIAHYLKAGRFDPRQPFRALVAGGGTGDGTIMLAQQLANVAIDAGLKPRAAPHEVVHLDLSQASRAVCEARAQARGLANIRFVSGSLLEVAEIAPGPYDYIDCCGVLHHLEDPPTGLAALASVLAPDGGIGLMLYGALGRRGVYELQEALRALVAGEPLQKQVALAKRLLPLLPASNWFRRNPFLGDHRQSDAGLVDLLLHARDRAYRVPEVVELVESAGLRLVSFIEPFRYDPATYVSEQEFQPRFAALPERWRWAVAEALAGNIKTHVVYATRRPAGEDTVARLTPEAVPVLTKHAGAELARAAQRDLALQFELGGLNVRRALPRLAPALLARIDGKHSFSAIVDDLLAASPGLERTAVEADFRLLYQLLNQANLLLLRATA